HEDAAVDRFGLDVAAPHPTEAESRARVDDGARDVLLRAQRHVATGQVGERAARTDGAERERAAAGRERDGAAGHEIVARTRDAAGGADVDAARHGRADLVEG